MTRHRQHVDDHAEVADLLGDVPTQRAKPFADSSLLSLDTLGNVDEPDRTTRRNALYTVAEHATSPDDLTQLAATLGLTDDLHAWDGPTPSNTLAIPQALAGHIESQNAPCDHPDECVIAPDAPAGAPHLHRHVHNPFVAWHPDGTAYAMCESCWTTWDRQPCEACGSYVAAIHIALTGRARHANHPEPK